MVSGQTKTGFKYKIQDSQLNNWELIEVLQTIDEGNETMLPKAIKMLLGNKQYERLKNHVRRNGIVPVDKMLLEFQDIMQNKQVKN